MWPFGEARRISELEDGLGKLKRDFQELELEWTNVYDKLRKVMGRIVKSRAIIEQRETAVEEESSARLAPTAEVPTIGGFLTPHQREIQQQILKRRAGG